VEVEDDEKEIKKFVKEKIRSLDSVNSTGILEIREDLEDLKINEEELFEEEEGESRMRRRDWEPEP